MKSPTLAIRRAEKWPIAIGVIAIGMLIALLGYWGARAQITGAIISTGTIVLQSDRQVVQHRDGGVVVNIFARNGDLVRAGDTIIQLDDTFLRSELVVIQQQLVEINARKQRWTAESNGLTNLSIPAMGKIAGIGPDWVQEQNDGQVRLFRARLQSLRLEHAHMTKKVNQIHRQIEGINAQQKALIQQRTLAKAELRDQENLRAKGLVPAVRVLTLQREVASLSGQIAQMTASRAQALEKISGLAIAALKLDDRRRQDAINRIRDLRFSEIELLEKRRNLQERIHRLAIRAPVSGTVHNSIISSLNSVVRAAEPLMFVVPGDKSMHISARVNPIHIDQIYPTQRVWLRLATSDQSRNSDIMGQVLRLSPDILYDELTGVPYYEAIIETLPENSARQSTEIQFRIGMPVDVFIKTGERTPISYLVQPFADYFGRAFRET